MAFEPATMWLAAFAGIVTDSAQKETGWAVRSGNLVPARTIRSTAGTAGGFCAGAEPAQTAVQASAAPTIASRITYPFGYDGSIVVCVFAQALREG
jgi:hypothetical protein